MPRFDRAWCRAYMLVLLVFTLTLVGIPVFAGPGPEAFVLLDTATPAAMRSALAAVTAAGGTVRHSFPPHAAIIELPAGAERLLAQHRHLHSVTRGSVALDTIPASYGRTAQEAAQTWNRLYTSPQPSPAMPLDAQPLTGDARLSPRDLLAPRAGAGAPAPPGASQWQTSEYLLGSTTVSLILLESNGVVDANTENWTPAEQTLVTSECVAGMNWWVAKYPYTAGAPSFTWEFHYAVPTGYEPISRSSGDDYRWITDALNFLGYDATTNYWGALYEYLNDLRDAHGTDWAYVVFLVDSSADADGTFTDGYFAYAYINGPSVVMTYDNDGWGVNWMDRVLAHEAGHIFGAGDEYCSPGYACCSADEYYGYLHIQNTNCDSGVPCLMNDNSDVVCSVTAPQVGWRDGDSNGIPDILDVPPSATITPYSPDPAADTTPAFTGSASVGFYPNQNPWSSGDVTVNRIAAVQYRINGGPWLDATAADGGFDSASEGYTFTTAPLSQQTYMFEVRAVDTSGGVTAPPYPSDTLTIFGHSITVEAQADRTLIPSGTMIQLTGSATDLEGHTIILYEWDDGTAGGLFLPAASATSPAYEAPANTSSAELQLTLTLSATCDGPSPTTEVDTLAVTVTYDFDGDGMADYWEQAWGLDDEAAADAALDADGDGLTNLEEFLAGTNPGSGDTDADGLPDPWELAHGYDPGNPVDAAADLDHDGLTTLQEYQDSTDPSDRDSDEDGFGDAEEVTLSSDPNNPLSKPGHGHFSDVDPAGYGTGGTDPYWAFHEIEACYRAGIVNGYPDGAYQPTAPVLRDQMAVYVARALAGGDAAVPKDYTVATFVDIQPGHWAFHYIEYAAGLSIVRGYPDGLYYPGNAVTRDQMAVYIARAIVDPVGDDSNLPRPAVPAFSDVPTEAWAYTQVEYCHARGVVNGYPDGLYHPLNTVTRDQMAVFITRAFDLPW